MRGGGTWGPQLEKMTFKLERGRHVPVNIASMQNLTCATTTMAFFFNKSYKKNSAGKYLTAPLKIGVVHITSEMTDITMQTPSELESRH